MKEYQKIKVMFVNHTATIGGAERSLLDILTFIDKNKFELLFVCFEEGPLVKKVNEIKGVDVTVIPFPNKILKFNRDKNSFNQVIIPFYLILPIIKFLIFTQKSKVKVLYTNSMKAHFIGVLVGKLTTKKVIWHVRDILEDGINMRLFLSLSNLSDEIICISKAVAKQFKDRQKVKIVYNGVLPIKEVHINE